MLNDDKIFVAGHRGLVGSAFVELLKQKSYSRILTSTRSDLDLTNQKDVNDFFKFEKPKHVFLAAARVGGINANNSYPAEFIYDNLMIELNIINAAYKNDVEKLLFLGSSCIYPRLAEQPIKEEYLLSGKLEPTNEAYAIAKISGIKICESYNKQYGTDFRSVMPTNLYGPNDNFDPLNSHVIPGLLNKFYLAKKNNDKAIKIWGTGKPLREFLYVEDMVDACFYLLNLSKNEYTKHLTTSCSHINIGSGEEISILDLAKLIKEIVGYNGDIDFDSSMPDGTPRKFLDNSLLKKMGWVPKTDLRSGIEKTYNSLLENIDV